MSRLVKYIIVFVVFNLFMFLISSLSGAGVTFFVTLLSMITSFSHLWMNFFDRRYK